MPRRCVARQEEEKHRHHQDAREKNADRDQHTELRETGRIREQQREKTDRGRERAEEDRAAQIFYRDGDGGAVIVAVVTRLLVASENENREIDPESDEDGAEANRHHIELTENQQPGGE
jgi:hypothetical protein